MNVTFDTNCIIHLEENRPAAPYVRRIVQGAAERGLKLRVVGISASERSRDGQYPRSFGDFETKIAGVGLGDVEILKPPAILDVTYWDHCVLGCEEWTEEARRIHEILFPTIPFTYTDFRVRFGVDPAAPGLHYKWRNRAIDTRALWTHMHNGGGVFVTSDNDFHKPEEKKSSLARLGAGEILRPKEAAERLCPGQ